MKAIRGKRGGTLLLWEKGQSGNPKGRPRKIATTLAVKGYSRYEINDTFERLGVLTFAELEEFQSRDDITVVEIGICKMISGMMKDGKTEFLEYLIPKKQAKLEVEAKVVDYEIPDDDISASKKYQEIMSDG